MVVSVSLSVSLLSSEGCFCSWSLSSIGDCWVWSVLTGRFKVTVVVLFTGVIGYGFVLRFLCLTSLSLTLLYFCGAVWLILILWFASWVKNSSLSSKMGKTWTWCSVLVPPCSEVDKSPTPLEGGVMIGKAAPVGSYDVVDKVMVFRPSPWLLW